MPGQLEVHSAIEYTPTMESKMGASARKTKHLKGIGVAGGVASGLATIYHRRLPPVPSPEAPDKEHTEADRFSLALRAAREELHTLAAQVRERLGPDEAAIFGAQELFLEDPSLLQTTQAAISQGKSAAKAWWTSVCQAALQLRALGEEPWISLSEDLEDVGRRVLRHLTGENASDARPAVKECIVLARDLTASETMTLAEEGAIGFALTEGSKTSHATILAKALEIPMVIGLGEELGQILPETPVILDGDTGQLTAWPEPSQRSTSPHIRHPVQPVREPAFTQDGYQISILANVNSVAEARQAVELGADGIGLLRTEFLYLGRNELPDEEEQAATYAAILDILEGRPLTVRTLDISKDKAIPALALPEECVPALGVRGIRASLREPSLLLTQLRAILRAARSSTPTAHPRQIACIRVMFPLVSTLEEWRAVRALVDEAMAMLAPDKRPAELISVGMMIEVPSAALLSDIFAQEVDFFSIGTNDLAQYTMAADRDCAQVAPLLSGLQPALLRLLHLIVQNAQRASRSVSLCGEIAADPEALPLLVGLGIDTLSMNPAAIPMAKERVRRLSVTAARQLAEECLACGTLEEVRTIVQARQ